MTATLIFALAAMSLLFAGALGLCLKASLAAEAAAHHAFWAERHAEAAAAHAVKAKAVADRASHEAAATPVDLRPAQSPKALWCPLHGRWRCDCHAPKYGTIPATDLDPTPEEDRG